MPLPLPSSGRITWDDRDPASDQGIELLYGGLIVAPGLRHPHWPMDNIAISRVDEPLSREKALAAARAAGADTADEAFTLRVRRCSRGS